MNKTLTIRIAMVTVILSGVVLFGKPSKVDADPTPKMVDYGTSTAAICLVKAAKPDDRAERLDTYFRERSMPLEGYGKSFVAAADSCGLDWRLVPAIGIRESSGGKRLMNNNPFGWGSAKIPFKNFDEAIVEVTNNLCGIDPDTARYYKDKTIERKLWYYNGSVMPSYTKEVLAIMDRF